MFKITLSAARVRTGYSQKEAAKLLGISNASLVKYEKNGGAVPISFAEKLARLYKVPREMLFFGVQKDFTEEIRNQEIQSIEIESI